MADSIEHIGFWDYPKQPDPNVDYGDNDLPETTCAECGQVWLREDIDDMGMCPVCRPVDELDEEDKEWWDRMTRGCEKSHREREERND